MAVAFATSVLSLTGVAMRSGFGRLLVLVVVTLVASGTMSLGPAVADTSASGYTLSVIAGRPRIVSGTPVGDNRFGDWGGTVVDPGGGFYMGDPGDGYVLRLSASGNLALLAGDGDPRLSGAPVAGPAAATSVVPSALAVDGSGTIYIADKRGYIEAVSPSGTLAVLAGNGSTGVPVPGPATSSPLDPQALALDAAGNLYIGTAQYVLKLTPGGILSVIAGNGTTPTSANPPIPGPAAASPISASGLAFDPTGNLYVADPSGWLDKVTPGGTLSVAAGNGTIGAPIAGPAAQSPIAPSSLAFDASGNLYAGDQHGYIDKIAPDGTLSIFAGNGTSWAATPGQATSSDVDPLGLATDAGGNVYFGDGWSGGLVKVTPSGSLSIISNGNWTRVPPKPGPADMSPMSADSVAVDHTGVVYVGDRAVHDIYKITPDGNLSIFAVDVDPSLMTIDAQNDLYFVTNDITTIDKITPSGTLTVVAGGRGQGPPVVGPALESPQAAEGLAFDRRGNLYVANADGYIEKITPAGQESIVAGRGDWQDAPVPGPAMSSPMEPYALAIDSLGNLYIGDPKGYVEKVTPGGTLSIFAGNGHTTGARVPGPATASAVSPYALAVDPWDNVFINDIGHVDEVNPAGTLSIIAGTDGAGYGSWRPPTQGPATSAVIFPYQGLAIDDTGGVYVASSLFVVRLQAPALNPGTPTVTGIPRVGDTMTAHPGTWGPGTVTFGYQWLANGVAISGATAPTYTETASVLGRHITVRVAGYESGYASRAATSASTTSVAAGMISERSRPYLSGTARVGYTLTLHPGTWSPSGATLRYRWLRDGRAFTRLTTITHYGLSRTDLGHRISVEVVVTKWGYGSRSVTTTSTSQVT